MKYSSTEAVSHSFCSLRYKGSQRDSFQFGRESPGTGGERREGLTLGYSAGLLPASASARCQKRAIKHVSNPSGTRRVSGRPAPSHKHRSPHLWLQELERAALRGAGREDDGRVRGGRIGAELVGVGETGFLGFLDLCQQYCSCSLSRPIE